MRRYIGFCASLIVVIFTGSANAGLSAAPYPSCTFEHAHYSLRGYSDVEVGFQKHAKTHLFPGDLFLYLRVKSRGWTYWYFPESGAGYSDISLIPIDNPQGRPLDQVMTLAPDKAERLTFFGLMKDLTFVADYPKSRVAAPEMLFIPELGPLIYYDVRGIRTTRYNVPRAFLMLDRCN